MCGGDDDADGSMLDFVSKTRQKKIKRLLLDLVSKLIAFGSKLERRCGVGDLSLGEL